MESGEKELRKAFEETTTKNVRTLESYTRDSRNMVRELEAKVDRLEEIVRKQTETIESMRSQLAGVQTIIFSGGT